MNGSESNSIQKPTNTQRKPKIFLAAPYSQWMDWHCGRILPHWQERLERLRRELILSGAAVFSAHYNEQWGEAWLPAEICTRADFAALQVSDTVCAVIGQPPSGGVAVELGWAAALRKPSLVILQSEGSCTPLIHGLPSIVHAEFLEEDLDMQNSLRRIWNGRTSL